MKVILHADDFGYDKDTTAATIELLECGALTSASIMATMPAAKEAIAYAAKHPEYSFGVHLTYVDGLKPALQKEGSTLLNEKGVFYPSNMVRKSSIALKLKKQDIVDESIAQIEIVRNGGVNISHLDSHGHLHKFPSFLLAFPEIKMRSDMNRVRRVQNVFLQKPVMKVSTLLNRCFDWRIAHTCKTTDYFYMSANNMDTGWADAILAQMDKLPQDAIIEIGVHPGKQQQGKEAWRYNEYLDVIDFAEKVLKGGKHEIENWNSLC